MEEVHCKLLLHSFSITCFDKRKQCLFNGKEKEHKSFNTLKEKINTNPILALLDLQQPFEIEIDYSDYDMGAVLMQHKKPICYDSKTFSKTIINYPTYDKELYALVQSVKK